MSFFIQKGLKSFKQIATVFIKVIFLKASCWHQPMPEVKWENFINSVNGYQYNWNTSYNPLFQTFYLDNLSVNLMVLGIAMFFHCILIIKDN